VVSIQLPKTFHSCPRRSTLSAADEDVWRTGDISVWRSDVSGQMCRIIRELLYIRKTFDIIFTPAWLA